jgi:hypothetical protein
MRRTNCSCSASCRSSSCSLRSRSSAMSDNGSGHGWFRVASSFNSLTSLGSCDPAGRGADDEACNPATTGCRFGAMDWLGRIASDFRTARFSGDMQNPRALQRRASV